MSISRNIASNTAWASVGPGSGSAFNRRIDQIDMQPDGVEPSVQCVRNTERRIQVWIARGGHGRAVKLEGGALVLVASAKKTGQARLIWFSGPWPH